MSTAKLKRTGMSKVKNHSQRKPKKPTNGYNDNETDIKSSGHVTPQPHLFSQENQLSNLFASRGNIKKSSSSQNSKFSFDTTGRDDNEFMYKRSQSPIRTQSRKRRRVNTPVTQLHEEMDLLSRNDSDSDSDDIFKLPKNRWNKSKKQHEEVSTTLRSPLGDDYKSEDFTSQDTLERRDRGDKFDRRRQSYINRGKRLSSIGSGFVGEPHKDVPVNEYYKHLDSNMPPPDRMRQLLIWSMKKQLSIDETNPKQIQSDEDQTAFNIAKIIQKELIDDLVNNKVSSRWYGSNNNNLDETGGKMVRVPNPVNISNRQNIGLYSQKIEDLKRQKTEWETVYRQSILPVEQMKISLPDDKDQLKKYIDEERQVKVPLDVLESMNVVDVENSYKEVKGEVKTLEPNLDRLYYSTYQVNKAAKLIQSVEKDVLGDKVTKYMQNYTDRSRTPELQNQVSKSSFHKVWVVPTKKIDIVDHLRAICELDIQNKK
ncbi:mis13 Kinetochore protein mis13 [Candida maltosa Xu316]